MSAAVVVGGGPAGLMAAEVLSGAGVHVTLCEAKPSVGRKFLMAGKSGLNLTKAEDPQRFKQAFAEAEGPLAPMIDAFDAQAVQTWAEDLGQTVFTGSTGRVFPVAMKASPLLRAWLRRLDERRVEIRTRWVWRGWSGEDLVFDTPDGVRQLKADVVVLALGGASWARLGADGAWADVLHKAGISVRPFLPANAGIKVEWRAPMARHFGAPLKGVAWRAGSYVSRGEATISARGLEGGGIYAVSRGVREGMPLMVDLLPDQILAQVSERLAKPRGKTSQSTFLRKRLKLSAAQIAMLQEMAYPLPSDAGALAGLIKGVPVRHAELRPIDEAISTAGGVAFAALDDTLMLRQRPGVFVAGEMVDWEAPTGGYLITACLATGRWAGQHAARWAQGRST